MSSSSSSSSDLETDITPHIIEKKSTSKKKKRRSSTATPVIQDAVQARNEGTDPHWAYEPPKDARLLGHAVDAGPFDWDAIHDDDDTEIWLIRVPDTIKVKHLQDLEIDAPASSRTARVGSLTKKNTSYDVWSLADDDAKVVGGEELRGLSCLLPRKSSDGKLYLAPKRVSHHIVITARPPIATSPDPPIIYQNPPRSSYPKDMLKHTFVPYGARSEHAQPTNVSTEDGDTEIVLEKFSDVTAHPPKDKPAKIKSEFKGKKRKADDGNAPKSLKKHKAKA